MTRCKQCQLDGHHKMSCTDESNPARKDRVTVPTSLKEPIVESQMEHVHPQMLKQLKERAARCTELEKAAAEVVAELRVCQKRAALIAADSDNDPFRLGRESAWGNAADLVAKKLGVES